MNILQDSKRVNKQEAEAFVNDLLAKMTWQEKLGQMSQRPFDQLPKDPTEVLSNGLVGSIINLVDVDQVNKLQKVVLENSRLGIPLLIGRDVIHGFQTVFPIPLGQAASWNPDIIYQASSVAATEASASGVRWTFAPMIDVTRDPRWGRISESCGEDAYLAGVVGAAMVKGLQGDDPSQPDRIAACIKHFAGYGFSEGGRDYAFVNLSDSEMRNHVLPPFKACIEAGAMTLMTAFSDINGIPASGHRQLLRDVLRDEWQFDGFVVSDWDSIIEMVKHGFVEDFRDAGRLALEAGVDMEMSSTTYLDYVEEMIEAGDIDGDLINQAAKNILMTKYKLGLFQNPFTDNSEFKGYAHQDFLNVAYDMALESCVLLKNQNEALPLNSSDLKNLAIIGPFADNGHDQMGTWVFDGKKEFCQTPVNAIKEIVGEKVSLHIHQGISHSRSTDKSAFAAAKICVEKSDVVLLFLGEEAILSGEAHCRADISLPGCQESLIKEMSSLGKKVILVVMAGRPLTIENILPYVDAVLFAWHPGTMGGPAIADLIFGKKSPSGKLPITFPRTVGQIPIYYNGRNSGRPPSPETSLLMADIEIGQEQTSTGNNSYYLDYGFKPLYPFGYGLSYGKFEYSNINITDKKVNLGDAIEVCVTVKNIGKMDASEVCQLYIRDVVGSITRPVRELKKFKKIYLKSNESIEVIFKLESNDLGFYNQYNKFVIEPGKFEVFIGGDSNAELMTSFHIHKNIV